MFSSNIDLDLLPPLRPVVSPPPLALIATFTAVRTLPGPSNLQAASLHYMENGHARTVMALKSDYFAENKGLKAGNSTLLISNLKLETLPVGKIFLEKAGEVFWNSLPILP